MRGAAFPLEPVWGYPITGFDVSISEEDKKNADAAFGCVFAAFAVIALPILAIGSCGGNGPAEEPRYSREDYCSDHRSAVLSAEAEVNRIKGLIATADAAATTGNASSLQGYLEFKIEADQALATAERRLKEAERTHDNVCVR